MKDQPIWTSGDGEAKRCWWREQQERRLNDENWVACELRNPLIQNRSRAKSLEGGAWAGFALTWNTAATWEGLHT